MNSLHAFSEYLSYVMYSNSNPAELQTLVHAHWKVAKTDRWLQLSQVTPLYQMHDTQHEDNSSRKLYLKSPLALHPISCDLTVAFPASLSPAYVTVEVCVSVTYTELCIPQQKCTCCTLSLFTSIPVLTSRGLPSHSPSTH